MGVDERAIREVHATWIEAAGEMAYTRSRDALTVTPRAGGEATQPGIESRYTANSPAAAGSWPAMPTRCSR